MEGYCDGYFGNHLTIDFYGCPPEPLLDERYIDQCLVDLIEAAGMRLFMGPYSKTASDGKVPEDIGVTGVAVLYDSHVTIHSFPLRDGYLAFDIFSCKEFDEDKILGLMTKRFKPREHEINRLRRGLKFKR